MIIALALAIGILAGLRAAMPLAVVSWGARLGHFHLHHAWLGFMSSAWAPWVFSALALGEIINDKRASTPSRKIPPQFIGRIVSGACAGACVGLTFETPWVGLACGAVGAVIGTLGGAAVRGALARAFGRDLPAALLEDAVAIALGVALVVYV